MYIDTIPEAGKSIEVLRCFFYFHSFIFFLSFFLSLSFFSFFFLSTNSFVEEIKYVCHIYILYNINLPVNKKIHSRRRNYMHTHTHRHTHTQTHTYTY